MKIKTSELTGAALDWAVAKCEGEVYSPVETYDGIGLRYPATRYSSDWALGGPIIERESITVIRIDDDFGVDAKGFCNNVRIPVWGATTGQHGPQEQYEGERYPPQYEVSAHDVVNGSTLLIAAMRCYVASKLGDEVDLPNSIKSTDE